MVSLRRSRRVQADGSGLDQQSETFRMLRANLLVALDDLDDSTVVVTSALPGEGKSTVCANLALALAEAGKRVVAVDTDLRHPNLHARIGGHNEVGLSDVLLERAPIGEALQFVSTGSRNRGLYVLSTGAPVNDPTELLGSARTTQLLGRLASQVDVLLLDTPPVLPVADTLVIGRTVAGALLVVESRRTPVPVVQQAKNALIRNQTRLLGVVLNKVQARDLGATGNGYYPYS